MMNIERYGNTTAGTIPLFTQDATFVEEIYGEHALDLILPREDPQGKILDLLSRPTHYAMILRGIRGLLAEKHSYTARLRELIEIVES
jgi:hypothetical protein